MASWEVSPILAPLIADVKREFPGIVVGTIGDPAHQAEATGSDHNPDQYGFVCAADFMFGNGFGATQAEALFDRLNQLRDSRTAYAIYNRRIESSTVSPWTVRSYTGTDPHTGHVHVSVKHSSNPRPTTSWNVYPPAPEDDMPLTTDDLTAVRAQVALGLYDALWSAKNHVNVGNPVRVPYVGVGDAIESNLQAIVGKPVDQAALLQAIAAADNVDEAALAAALVPGLSAAIIAALPDTALTAADVEAAVRDVLRTGVGS